MPKCPICGKKMKNRAFLKFEWGLEDAIRAITDKPYFKPRYCCVTMIDNEKHKEWLKEKQKYDQEMSKYQQAVEDNKRRIFKKKLPPKPKDPPPEPLKKIPCENHYMYNSKLSEKSNKLVRKKYLFWTSDNLDKLDLPGDLNEVESLF